MTRFESFLDGLMLSAIASLFSLPIALWGFGRTYHLSILLSAFAASYVLAAWITYTKRTPIRACKPQETETEFKGNDYRVFGAPPEEGLHKRDRVRAFLRNPIPALLWSALQLNILIAVLYSIFNIGATYHP